MRDVKKLKAALERATQDAGDDLVSNPQDCLLRLLNEIDAAVLPRDLTFENDAGQTLILTAKSRRLVRVGTKTPGSLGHAQGVLDTELSEDPAQMTALAHVLTGFSARTSTLSVTSAKPAKQDALNEVGLSLARVRDALLSTGYTLASEQVDILARLIKLARQHGIEWMLYDGQDVTATEGSRDALLELSEAALPYIMKTERPASGQTQSWMFANVSSACIAITVQDDAYLIAKVPEALTQSWVSTCAGRQ